MAPSRRSRSALAEIKASPPNSQTRGSTNKKTEALGKVAPPEPKMKPTPKRSRSKIENEENAEMTKVNGKKESPPVVENVKEEAVVKEEAPPAVEYVEEEAVVKEEAPPAIESVKEEAAPPAVVKDEEEEQPRSQQGRKVKEEEDSDEEVGENTLMMESGIISAEALKEEEKARKDNLKKEKQRNYYGEPLSELSQNQRYEMLMELLKRSEFFTGYIKQKMEDEEEADEIKKKKEEIRAKKMAAKGKSVPVGKKSVRKTTPKFAEESGKGKGKRMAEEEGNVESKKVKVGLDRNWNGQHISEDQPLLLSGGIMRNYQLEGYLWLAKLYENGINGILADEMGLGKTIQCIALFCYLYEMGVGGPFLVVAPLSTVPNWVNEFKRFAPKIPCMLYHGSKQERMELRERMGETVTCDEVDGLMFNVIVTSYEIAMNDRAVLAPVSWKYLCVDEGHRLKNIDCRLVRELKKYNSDHRLLLTGTPLQNNLRELFSLLNFVLPDIFDNVEVFESWFDAKEIHEDEENSNSKILAQEQKNSVVNMLHQILLPFLRRRVKTDVGLEIPPKKEVLVYCPLTPRQKEMYQAVVEKTLGDLLGPKEEIDHETQGRGKRKKDSIDYSIFDSETEYKNDDKFENSVRKLSNAVNKGMPAASTAYVMKLNEKNEINFSIKNRMMDMRKAVNHPYLINYPISEDGVYYKVDNDIVDICGKLKVLDQMLTELMARGHKILLFSQMTRMLDILGDYLGFRNLTFSRLDGSMSFVDRQENIDRFNQDPKIPIFLLSTRAGGLGINLTAADTCIIYDSDWNPQQDLQAQDRCHRIGQSKPVMVYRMVTKGTIDEKIVLRAAAKRKIEKLVIHKDKFNKLKDVPEAGKIDAEELLQLLHSKDHVGAVTCQEGNVLSDSDLNKLLDRSDLTWGEKDKNKNKKVAVKEVAGVFQVLDSDIGEGSGLNSVTE